MNWLRNIWYVSALVWVVQAIYARVTGQDRATVCTFVALGMLAYICACVTPERRPK